MVATLGRLAPRPVVGLVSLALAAGLATASESPAVGGDVRARVMVSADATDRDRIAARGLDVAGHDLRGDRLELIVTPEELAWLARQGFKIELIELRDGPQPLAQGSSAVGADVPLADARYTDPAEMEAYLMRVAADHPAITRLVALGTTHEGRTIWGLMISDNAAVDEDELAILFNGAHHAREVMTPEIVIDTIDVLTDSYGIDPDTTRRVDEYQIWCVPIVNPDGVARVHVTDDLWRKNLRDNDSSGTITSQDGVDLNRNYEWGWGNQCQGSSGTFSSQTYRGPSEGSEPETRAMAELGRLVRPVFDVEYHSYGEDVLYAMSCDPQFSPTLSTITGPDQSISRVIAEEYASRVIQADGGVGYAPAPYGSRVDGTGRDQQFHENGSIAFVTEVNTSLEGGFHPDYGTYRQPTVEGHRPAWQWLIDRISGPAIGGRVTDAVTGSPVAAEISLDEMQLPDGRRLTSREDSGRFHVIVVPGSYTLRVAAPGYEYAVVPLVVGASWVATDVALIPTGSARLVSETFENPASAAAWSAGVPGDTANDGFWSLGDPEGTHSGDVVSGTLAFGNPLLDSTAGSGTKAFVTGNAIAATIDSDDVDGGVTTLQSPAYDLSGHYGVTVSWQRWLLNDSGSSQNRLETEVSADGGETWLILESLTSSTATADASPAWTPASARLDDLVAPGPDVRLRFRAEDRGADDTVEAAIDDIEIRGYSIAVQGEISGVVVDDAAATVVAWNPVPGGQGAVYDVGRGELSQLTAGAGVVNLGPLACIENDSSDTTSSGSPDTGIPAAGTGRFYVVRFALGESLGGYGRGTSGDERQGSAGCAP